MRPVHIKAFPQVFNLKSLNSKPIFPVNKKRPIAELKLLGYVIKAHLHTHKGAERGSDGNPFQCLTTLTASKDFSHLV